MIYTFVASSLAFIATNIDDLFINMLLYLGSNSKKEDSAITAGKFSGTAILLAISCLGAAGLQLLAADRLWLLGFVPVALGIKEIVSTKKDSDTEHFTVTDAVCATPTKTMLITLASGADNIGVYLPLMAGFSGRQIFVAAVVFFTLTGLFCAAGRHLAHMPVLETAVRKHRHILVPAIYIILGLYIIFM